MTEAGEALEPEEAEAREEGGGELGTWLLQREGIFSAE